MRSRDGAHDQENAPMSPDPFPRERLGSGNETIHDRAFLAMYRVGVVRWGSGARDQVKVD